MPFKRSIDNHTNSIQGLTGSEREGFDEISHRYHIYTKTSWRDLRNPTLYIVIIASYGRATAAPVARFILLCICCHGMGFLVLHPQRLGGGSPFRH